MFPKLVALLGDVLPWALLLLAGINSTVGNLLLKQSRIASGAPGFLGMIKSPWFLGGLLFYALNVVLFAKALDRLQVAAAYPVLAGISFALLVFASAIIFGERFSALQVFGLIAVLVGIVAIARG